MSKAILPSLDAPLWSRWLFSLLLPLIALAVYWEGQDYDPGLVQLQAADQAEIPPLPEQLAGQPRFSQLRTYNKENLYEYINGHAEYFLGAGFQGLTAAEYGPKSAPQPQLLVNLYHMGKPLFAFGALMDELAEEGQPVEGIGSMAFTTGSGMNFIQGPYYVQVSSFDSQLDLNQAARELDKALQQEPGQAEKLDLDFPDLGETRATYFVKEDYRGLGFLHNVLERVFQRGGDEFTAFLINGQAEYISGTTESLLSFLNQDGIPVEQQIFEGMSYHSVNDPYEGEWFFVPGETRLLGAFTTPQPEILGAIKGNGP